MTKGELESQLTQAREQIERLAKLYHKDCLELNEQVAAKDAQLALAREVIHRYSKAINAMDRLSESDKDEFEILDSIRRIIESELKALAQWDQENKENK